MRVEAQQTSEAFLKILGDANIVTIDRTAFVGPLPLTVTGLNPGRFTPRLPQTCSKQALFMDCRRAADMPQA